MFTFYTTEGISAFAPSSTADIARESLSEFLAAEKIRESRDANDRMQFGGELQSMAFILESPAYAIMIAGASIAGGVAVKEFTKDVYGVVKRCLSRLCTRSNETAAAGRDTTGVHLLASRVESVGDSDARDDGRLAFRIFAKKSSIDLDGLQKRLAGYEKLLAIVGDELDTDHHLRFEYGPGDDYLYWASFDDASGGTVILELHNGALEVTEHGTVSSSPLHGLGERLERAVRERMDVQA